MSSDLIKQAADLERLLKLRTSPFGMKLFANAADMEAIPRIRRPKAVHAFDQIVGQARGVFVSGDTAHLLRPRFARFFSRLE